MIGVQVGYKFLDGNKSRKGNQTWRKDRWYHEEEIELCESGWHCSEYIQDALSWVNGDTLAVVEVRGKHEICDTKQVWQDMKVVKRYRWTKKQSLMLSLIALDECREQYESVYSDSDLFERVVAAVRNVLERDTAENRKAAWAVAEAVWAAAWAARTAAEAAVWAAAEAAVWAATAKAAAWAAKAAAWAARTAAEAATRKRIHERIIAEILPTMRGI